jgi:hypothetical protein
MGGGALIGDGIPTGGAVGGGGAALVANVTSKAGAYTRPLFGST